MNIWLPIITNLVILGILVASFFAGKKNGIKLQLVKLFLIAGAGVGCYFLAPLVSKLLLKISFVDTIVNTVAAHLALNSLSFLLAFVVFYGLISIAILIIRKIARKHKGINIARPIKTKGIDRATTRKLRKEEKRLNKLERKEYAKKHKVSRAFGGLVGILVGIVAAFVVMLPVKFVSKAVVEAQPSLEKLESGYEYTPFGQLDKLVDISDFVIKE